MANNVQNVNKINAGTCPHGLPPGACPVCSQMGGGSTKKNDGPRKAGEMTYHQCAMLGNLMRARELAQKHHKANLKTRALNLQNFENTLLNLSAKMAEFIKQTSQNFFTKPIALAAKIVIMPVLTLIQNIPKLIQTLNNIKVEITDKLNAIYGEAKAFLQKKIENGLEILKKGVNFIFRVFKKNNTEDEDTKIDEDKKIFNLKTMINKIFKKLKRKKDEKDERSSEN